MVKVDANEQFEREPWTASSLAAVAGIHHTYIARLCRQGKLKSRKFGQAWLIPYETGVAWLKDRETKQQPKED